MSAIAVADALGRLAEATLTFEDELQGPETIDNGLATGFFLVPAKSEHYNNLVG
jgi:hypothetical protein